MLARSVNGLNMSADFPVVDFERVYERAMARVATHSNECQHFSAAWNAVSIRFSSMVDEGRAFEMALAHEDAHISSALRFQQEKHIFGFFGNAYSTFEATFYGLFAVGAILRPAAFPIMTEREQQAISPNLAKRIFETAFVGDALVTAIQSALRDPAYLELREVRNILTHRTAPGRRITVSLSAEDGLVPEWKIRGIPLNDAVVPSRRAEVARLLGEMLAASASFVERQLPIV